MTTEGTKANPLKLKTPPLTSDYEICKDEKDGKEVMIEKPGLAGVTHNAK